MLRDTEGGDFQVMDIVMDINASNTAPIALAFKFISF